MQASHIVSLLVLVGIVLGAYLFFAPTAPPAGKAASGGVVSKEIVWMTDYEAAKKLAKAEHKNLLLDFTGSDWCGWCVKLREEVFEQKGFIPASKNFIFVELDFPQRLAQSEALKQQNAALAQQFGIRGFPTIVLTDADGQQIAQTGYRDGGAEAYVEHLESLLK